MFKTKTVHPKENAHSLRFIVLKEQLMVMDDIFELDK